jgi:hypothetical protein
MGDTYYLHEGKTKTGKSRYFFARTVRKGVLEKMPKGYECSESINGVVSVRRKVVENTLIPADDVRVVEAELGKYQHLRYYRAQVEKNAIVIFEPYPRVDELMMLDQFGFASSRTYFEQRMARAQYSPVMKFEREEQRYIAFRMTYRGSGGWSWPLASGDLQHLTKKLVRHIGTEEFFELM